MIYLNEHSSKAVTEIVGGNCNIHKTGFIPEPVVYHDTIPNHEIPIITISDNKIKEPCSICLNDFKKGEKVYFLQCIHCFHSDCLKRWIKNQVYCPKCKLKIINKLSD